MAGYYRPPNWLVRYVLNPQVTFTTWLGVGPGAARVLAVKGRKSGKWRTVPLNMVTQDGHRYLVSPRGETQWVRNLRAAGDGELRRGRRAESFHARELSDEEILAIAPKHPAFEVVPVSS